MFDSSSYWMPMHEPSPTNDVLQHLELFAGGFGGWKSACDFVASTNVTCKIRTIAVEFEPHIAMAYAITNHSGFIQQTQAIDKEFFVRNQQDWIIRDDVMSSSWKQAVAQVGIEVATLASPCPAWSAAHTAPGLSREDGAMLLQSLLECRFIRPRLIMIEQVSNFAQHPHRAIITRALHWMGYKIIFQKTTNPCELLRNDRPRGFGVARRVHADGAVVKIPTWISSELQPATQDVIFKCWSTETTQALSLNDQAIKAASDPRLTMSQGRSGDDILP